MATVSKRTLKYIKEELKLDVSDTVIDRIYNAGYRMGLKARTAIKKDAPLPDYLEEK